MQGQKRGMAKVKRIDDGVVFNFKISQKLLDAARERVCPLKHTFSITCRPAGSRKLSLVESEWFA